MLPNTTEHVLQVWETSIGALPLETGVRLLEVFGVHNAGSLSIGTIEALLLRMRAQLFGTRLDLTSDCPSCGNRVEWQLEVDDLLLPECSQASTLQLHTDGYTLELRLLTAADAIEAAKMDGPDQAFTTLLERALISAVSDGEVVLARDLPASVQNHLAARLAEADPQADVSFDLRCPACAHAWPASFDTPAFLTRELDTWAKRTIRDVHTLAVRYGWAEADILAMSPLRRNLYLELAQS